MPSIVVAGAIARRPHAGGHAWVFLQYVLGFRRLGFDVFFLDRLPGDSEYLDGVLGPFDIPYALLAVDGTGLVASREDVLDRVSQAALFLNVMGYVDDPEVLAAARLSVFLDIDPGFGQMWRELGLADVFAGHDRFLTVGASVGRDDCIVPTCGLDWITTRPPVVLEHWPVHATDDGAFTTVASWRGAYGPVDYRGGTYGLRVHEFRKFLSVPASVDTRFELALDIDATDEQDIARLLANGWRLVDPRAVAADPADYRAYVQRSRGEFTIAKNMYVDTRSGWFSDRSVCYLASGKPVVAQDTAARIEVPNGAGLLVFSTPEEAAAAVRSICEDYDAHSRAARSLAETYFDSDAVLTRLLERIDAR